jgi:hypothetical protein
MKFKALFLSLFLFSAILFAQEVDRNPIMGQVLYRSSNVVDEQVINTTSEEFTITDENGRFRIDVAVGDELVFMAVNYELKHLVITKEIIDNNRIVVEVNQKVNLLDEVVISPENRAKFLELKNEEFKQYVYEIDRGTEVENIAQPMYLRGMRNGINFVNIFKALFKENNEKDKPVFKLSDVLRAVYEDQFFVDNLYLSVDMIDDFLVYCDAQAPDRSLMLKKNEFELVQFLVEQSQAYLRENNE